MGIRRDNLVSWAYIIGGAVVGGIAGIGVAWGAKVYSIHANPTDPSAGSVGSMVVGTFPAGVFAGAIIALFLCARQLRRREENHGFEVVTRRKNSD